MIKAKDPYLALIDMPTLGFLLLETPLEGTQDAQFPAPLAVRLLYSREPPIRFDNKDKKSTTEPTQPEVTDRDFEVFYQQEELEDALSTSPVRLQPAQVSANQEATNIPIGMGFEEKTPDLLALLTAHNGGGSPTVLVMTRPPTLALTCTSFVEAVDKKRKMAQGVKGPEGIEEGEVTWSSHQLLAKEAQTRRGQQKKTLVGIAKDGGD